MNFNEYQAKASKTKVYPASANFYYPLLGLSGEVGELAGKVAKQLRGDVEWDAIVPAIEAEMGDILWMLAMLAEDLSIQLDDIAVANLEKLAGRAERGTLQGNGDTR